MAAIDIKKTHTLGKEKARQVAEEIAGKMKEKLDLEWAWAGDSLNFESKHGVAKGVKGTVSVTDTEIGVVVDLPFMLRPLKGMVEGKINERLNAI
jgi:putative polyhydroxyalkanoate system protein